MSSLKHQLASSGYNAEELFCHKANQELIEKLKAKKRSHLTLVHSSSQTDPRDQSDERHEKFAEDSGGPIKKVA